VTDGWGDDPSCTGEGYLIHLAQAELNKLDALDRWEGSEEKPRPERGPVDAVWRAAWRGELTERELAEWCEIVAKRVVSKVIDDSDELGREDGRKAERAERALRALGLFDQADKAYEAKRHLSLLEDFLPAVQNRLIAEDEKRVKQPSLQRRFTLAMLQSGFFDDLNKDDEPGNDKYGGFSKAAYDAAYRRISRMRKR
jgi:hypothetical protein